METILFDRLQHNFKKELAKISKAHPDVFKDKNIEDFVKLENTGQIALLIDDDLKRNILINSKILEAYDISIAPILE